jgi:urease accessory protein
MNPLFSPTRLGAFVFACTTWSAQAHTGHGTHSLMQGMVHPLSIDHLLAMVAVGLWSVSALNARQAWQGPMTFLLVLMLSAAAGAMGMVPDFLENAIALSVVLFGVMLVWHKTLPRSLGLGLIAIAASLHGLAHGAETPETGFAGYAIGFVLTTAALHLSGIGLGLGLRRLLAQHSRLTLGTVGLTMAGAGAYLFTQI